MAFDFSKLETSEGRSKFIGMMEKLNVGHLNLA